MRLIENSNTRKLYSSLTEDFFNPCKIEKDAYKLESVTKDSEEFPLNKDDEDFKDAVIRDFITYLDDVYGVETLEDAERVRKNVTNDDVNDYFTSLFYDIRDNDDDFDTADVAEEIIRREFHVPDTSNNHDNDESSTTDEANHEVEDDSKYELNETVDKKPNYVIFYLNGKELGGHDLKNEFEGERESAKELFAYENGVKPEDIEERLEYRENMNESVKSKKSTKNQQKEDKRVVMQQGNITCFKENDNTYYVFENENDNEVEHDNEESAMQDFMERVGIDIENELKEE